MTTLVAPADIQALGFKFEQFNLETTDDFAAWLQNYIDEAEAEIIVRVGGQEAFDAFVALSAQNAVLMAKGEKKLTESQLWSLRVISMDAMSVSARTEDFAAVRKGFVTNAETAEEAAWDIIGQVTGDLAGSSVASGTVETGPYHKVSC